MKTLILVLTYLSFSMSINAQEKMDSVKVKWNRNVIFSGAVESEKDNTVKFSFNEGSVLEIIYKEAERKADWTRTLLIFDNSDNELARFENGYKTKLGGDVLKNIIGNNKTLKVYTISLPTDPEMAARVRVRRVHLCTLVLN